LQDSPRSGRRAQRYARQARRGVCLPKGARYAGGKLQLQLSGWVYAPGGLEGKMAYKFNCGECGKEQAVKWLKPGDPAKCRACGATVTVPAGAQQIGDEYVTGRDPEPAEKTQASPWSCSTCKYLQKSPDVSSEDLGFCRRYPPRGQERYPAVTADDWCGEHAALE